MNDPMAALLTLTQGLPLAATLFPPNSRYLGIETAKLTTAAGVEVVYLRRRFVPPSEELALLREHRVVERDRLDNLAAKYFGDPELFWRICDANRALRPDELTEVAGRRLRITLPHGLQGALQDGGDG